MSSKQKDDILDNINDSLEEIIATLEEHHKVLKDLGYKNLTALEDLQRAIDNL